MAGIFEPPRSLRLGRRRWAFLRRRQSGQPGLQLVEFLLLIADLLLHGIQLLFSFKATRSFKAARTFSSSEGFLEPCEFAASAAGCVGVPGEPGILSCSAVALCTSPFFTTRVSSVMTLAGFSVFFFCARARREASATD